MLAASLCCASWSLASALAPQSPVLSEVMANNVTTLEDEDGDQPDWFEIANLDTQDLDLGGWHVSDDPADPLRWTFPSPTIVPAQSFLVVFASDKDRATSGEELHTDFKLKDEGEYLGLFAPNGAVVHEYAPEFGPMGPDVSYGLAYDSSGITAEEVWFAPATPGAANGPGGPWLRLPAFQPPLPTEFDDITITVRAIPVPGSIIQKLTLRHRVDHEGRESLSMRDDGSGGDRIAGDGEWTAVLPAGTAPPAHLLRWYFLAEDDRGGESREPPYPADDRSPQYYGTLIDDPSIQSELPVYHWFLKNPGLADRRQGTRASLYYDGRLYDNIFVRLRGGSSAGFFKLSYKFDFNPGDHFHWDSRFAPAEEINLNSTWSDKAFLRQPMAFEIYRQTGATAPHAHLSRLQQNGEFFSVCVFIEQPDSDLLSRTGLNPDGALYKMYNECTHAYSGVEKKTRHWEDHSDLEVLVQGVQLSGGALERFLFDHLDLPAVISYLAATVVIFDNDHIAKNYYLYRESDGDGEWRFLPWDKDLTWGRNYTIGGGVLNDEMFADKDPYCHPLFGDRQHPKNDGPWNRLIDACYRTPRVRAMMLRRLRTLMDEILQQKSVPFDERVLEQRLEALFLLAKPDVDLDEQRWGIPDWGTKALDFRGGLDQLESQYLNPRRRHLFQTHGPDGSDTIPGKQVRPHLGFGHLEAGGNEAEQYFEIVAPADTDIDVSGLRVTGGVDFELPGSAVVPAGDTLFVAADVRGFRGRSSSPRGGEGHFILGPFLGSLQAGEELRLLDRDGELLATSGAAEMVVRDLAAGAKAQLTVVGMQPDENAFFLASLFGGGPTDTPYGPMDLSLPVLLLGLAPADETGTAELLVDVPDDASGVSLWLQTLLIEEARFTNSFAEVIQ